MSGICAIVMKRDAFTGSGTLAQLSNASKSYDSETVQCKFESSGGAGAAIRLPTQQFFHGDQLSVACDADLSNELELLRTLDSSKGTECKSTAQLIAALYRASGSGMLETLRGAFSVVIWDAREKILLAFTDPFGTRRLAVYDGTDLLAVASRVDALAQCTGIDTSINPCAIANVLNFSSNIAPHTILLHATRLPPGTILHFQRGSVTTRRYWTMRYGAQQKCDEDSLSDELGGLVRSSVENYSKISDVGAVGCFLSGGTDSSTIVGTMSRLQNGPVHAFSVGFQEESFNELYYAKLAAERFRAHHHICFVNAEDCSTALPNIVRAFDEPYGNASAVPTYFCAKLAADHGIHVLLAGDGGDELFGGNERYATDKIFETYQAVPKPLRKGVIEPTLGCIRFKNGMVARATRYIRRSNLAPVERYFSYHFLRTNRVEDVFQPDFLAAMHGYFPLEVPTTLYNGALARDHLDRLLYIDLNLTLADNDLPKVIQMSELAGVRSRFPFLDLAVAEFSGRLPVDLKLKGLKKRYLFKRAFQDLLPTEILRKKKHGFGIPVAIWLKSNQTFREFSRDVLFSRAARERGFFRRDFIDELIRRNEAEESPYYGDILWSLFVSELWCQEVLDQKVSVPV